MKIGLLIQARANSTRFPGKVFEMLGDKQVLRHLVDTCESVKIFPKALEIETKVLAAANDVLTFEGKGYVTANLDCSHYVLDPNFHPLGDESNLLARYEVGIYHMKCDAFLRLTSDCPFLPQKLIEDAITALMTYDYVSNTMLKTFPDGFDVQGMSAKAFAWYTKQLDHEEHLFQTLDCNLSVQKEFQAAGFSMHQIVDGNQNIANPYHKANKLSIDVPDDLERLKKIYEARKK